MRITSLLAVPILVGLIALPTRAHAQVGFSVRIGTPEASVGVYSPARHGAWESNYQRWTPVTMYQANGHYYRTQPRDRHNRVVSSTSVQMYRYRNQYFAPPTDAGFAGRDRRFNNNGRNGNNGRGHGPDKD
jgi:hypothetical protein